MSMIVSQGDDKKETETVADMCCGTGSLILGHIANMREKNSAKKVIVTACDLDRTALLCAFIQCGINNVKGTFEYGNALTNEVFEVFYSAPISLSF